MGKKLQISPAFRYLFFINLLYANPTATSLYRKKERYRQAPPKLYKRILLSNLCFLPLLSVGLYLMFLATLDFKNLPYMLDYLFAFLILMNLMQSFPIFFNTFYESKDAEAYMPLPIAEKEVFLAKMATVAIYCLQIMAPIFSLFFLFFFKNGFGIFSLFLALFIFLAFYTIYLLLLLVFMQVLAKTAVFSKIKSKLITLFNSLGMLLTIGLIVGLQNFSKDLQKFLGEKAFASYGLLSGLLSTWRGSLLCLFIVIVCTILLCYFLEKSVNHNFYSYIQKIQKSTNKKVKREKLKKGYNLIKYNLDLIGNTDVIPQYILSPLLVPAILLVSNFSNMKDLLLSGGVNAYLIMGAVGLFTGIFLCSNANILPGIILSLDRENYHYLKSLPISRKKYLINKWLVSVGIFLILPTLLLLVLTFLMKKSWSSGLFGILVLWITTAFMSVHWIIYDKKHLLLDWQSISQLAGRYNRLLISLTIMFSVFFFTLIILLLPILVSIVSYKIFICLGIIIFFCIVLLGAIRFLWFLKRSER